MESLVLFSLEERVLTRARSALQQTGIRVLGACSVAGTAMAHLAVDSGDAAVTRHALEVAGVRVRHEREVLLNATEHRPRAAARLMEVIRAGSSTINFLYLATSAEQAGEPASGESVTEDSPS